MSRSSRGNQEPQPPPGGWRLMEAAEVLCARAAALYKQGGPELEAAVSAEQHRLRARSSRDPKLRLDAWLTLKLLDVIGLRRELQVTGRHLLNSGAPCERMPPDIIQDACERDNCDGTVFKRWVHFDFYHNLISTGHDLPDKHWNQAEPTNWNDARIKAEPVALAPASAAGPDTGVKMTFTEALCRAWFLLRIAGWPEDRPPPNRDDCYAAARAYFAGPIDRTEFRKIRNAMVPASWKARGRRSATKTEAR